MTRKLTTSEFIEKSIIKHGNKYDYSKSDYINNYSNVTIICKIHGKFDQVATNHLSGSGCYKCDPTIRLATSQFIEKAIKIHGNKFDYSKVNYQKNGIKVEIICKVHGSFIQNPGSHLYQRQGCPLCCNNQRSTTEEFIRKSQLKHGTLYDYSLVE